MRTLSDYRLEYKKENNKRAYKICLIVAPILRIASIIMILPTIFLSLYYLIGIFACLILSFIVDVGARMSVFTLKYEYSNGIFKVIKVNIDGDEKVTKLIECKKISNLTIISDKETKESDSLDYCFNSDDMIENLLVKFDYEQKTVYITPDKYMYAILEEEIKNGVSG